MGHAKKEQITIFPTNACDLRCVYCAAHSSAYQSCPEKIDLGFAKAGISDYFRDGTKDQIRYYSSGEPTQAMDIVSETWEFAYSLVGDRLISEMQTNCCFDQATLDWVSSHITYVWASIDGWAEIHDKYRPDKNNNSSHAKAIGNALQMKDRTFVGIRMTVVPETVDKQIELLEYFHNLGFNHVVSEPLFTPVKKGETERYESITCVDLGKYIKNFAQAWFAAERMGMTYVNSFMMNFDENVEFACRSCLPSPHLTTDGFVSACDLGFYGDTPLQDLIYGQYDSVGKQIQYFDNRIAKLRSRKCINIESCRDCSARNLCGGGCLGRAYHETKDFYGVIPDYCWATRYLASILPLDRVRIPYLHP
jgi:radical SAM protein with 4Fe4S-binding SPASM domain